MTDIIKIWENALWQRKKKNSTKMRCPGLNPDLPAMPVVDYGAVKDDTYGRWADA